MSRFTLLDQEVLFSTAFRGGMAEWAVWSAILAAKDEAGVVSINVAFLAAQWPETPREVIQRAWDFATMPDRDSHNKAHEGRRIVEELMDGEKTGRWVVVSHELYKRKLSKERRKEDEALRKGAGRAEESKRQREQIEALRKMNASITPYSAACTELAVLAGAAASEFGVPTWEVVGAASWDVKKRRYFTSTDEKKLRGHVGMTWLKQTIDVIKNRSRPLTFGAMRDA